MSRRNSHLVDNRLIMTPRNTLFLITQFPGIMSCSMTRETAKNHQVSRYFVIDKPRVLLLLFYVALAKEAVGNRKNGTTIRIFHETYKFYWNITICVLINTIRIFSKKETLTPLSSKTHKVNSE